MQWMDLYMAVSECVVLLCMILFYQYIYMEDGFTHKRSRYLFAGSFLVTLLCILLIPGIPEDAEMFSSFVFFCLYVLLTRKKRRLLGVFLVLPISGFLFMMVAASLSFYYVCTGGKASGYFSFLMDAVFCSALFFFWNRTRRLRQQMQEEKAFRKLERGERWLLNIGGSFIFVIAVVLIGILENVDGYDIDKGWRILFLMTGSISIALLTTVIIALVMQGGKKKYYQYTVGLQERYMQAEMEHFEAYRQSQEEVRRIRHDMKNHYMVICSLAEEGKNDALCSYLAQLGEVLSATDRELHCGNAIGDAILNEKNQRARRQNIRIEVDGRLPANCSIAMLDICTLFSNALDNALEYLEQSSLAERWIHVMIRGQGELCLLRFENPTEKEMELLPLGSTGKQEQEWHGFGLMNMERTVQKYGGRLERYLKEKEQLYCLEMTLFTTK